MDDIVLRVMFFLDNISLVQCQRVCTCWHNVAQSSSAILRRQLDFARREYALTRHCAKIRARVTRIDMEQRLRVTHMTYKNTPCSNFGVVGPWILKIVEPSDPTSPRQHHDRFEYRSEPLATVNNHIFCRSEPYTPGQLAKQIATGRLTDNFVDKMPSWSFQDLLDGLYHMSRDTWLFAIAIKPLSSSIAAYDFLKVVPMFCVSNDDNEVHHMADIVQRYFRSEKNTALTMASVYHILEDAFRDRYCDGIVTRWIVSVYMSVSCIPALRRLLETME